MNLTEIKTVYFIGIKGVGMSGLAVIAHGRGMEVFGSDTDEHFITDDTLHNAGISYFTSFNETNIERTLKGKPVESVLVVVTAAHLGMNNIEAVEASKRGFTAITYGEALGLFMSDKKGISVAGTHGKTTTSALLAHLFVKLGSDPSYLVGTSTIPSLGNAAHAGSGDYFIAEADEYVADPVFLKTPKLFFQHPQIVIITSVDWDHPDVFSSQQEIEKIFISFVNSLPENAVVIADRDNTGVRSILPNLQRTVVTYGLDQHVGAHISRIEATDTGTRFKLANNEKSYIVDIGLSGVHNVKNATAALVASTFAGLSIDRLITQIGSFHGSKRRFEMIGKVGENFLYDDYAHHPEEIIATLSAFRMKYPQRRIIALFQPHTFSRTIAFLDEFSLAFKEANIVAITDVFASSREAYNPLINGELVAKKIRETGKEAYFVKNIEEFTAQISTKLQENDILVTMGAGDIYTWHDAMKQVLVKASKEK